MWVLQKIYPLILFLKAVSSFNFIQEKLSVDYADKNYLDIYGTVYKLNETINALNGSAFFKIDLGKHVKFTVSGFKMINGDYKLKVAHLEGNIRGFTTMDAFGVSDLCLKYTKPPAVWPIKKGVWYHTEGWNPDPNKFPTPVPDGQWKSYVKLAFTNKTKIVEITWYVRTTSN